MAPTDPKISAPAVECRAVKLKFLAVFFTDGADVEDAIVPGAAADARRYINRSLRRRNRKIRNLDNVLDMSNYKETIPTNAGVHTR